MLFSITQFADASRVSLSGGTYSNPTSTDASLLTLESILL